MNSSMQRFVITLTALAVIYGMYWIFKTVSYELFYESMVKDTIREMVKPEYLKQ